MDAELNSIEWLMPAVKPTVPPAPQPDWKAFASRRRDTTSKREAVLRTAAELFLEKSYRRTSLNDVAERLKITKPALYHYFQNKEEILLGCYRWGTALIEQTLEEIAGRFPLRQHTVAARRPTRPEGALGAERLAVSSWFRVS